MSDLMIQVPAPGLPWVSGSSALALSYPLPYQLAARMTNVALTAQVQIGYACAIAASESAERAAACTERAWPDTPLRALVVQSYRALARERQAAAREVLARARKSCGLAYARLVP
jgi:hypothetical protein